VNGEERRIGAGVYRTDSSQFAGPPVEADEIDAIGPTTFGVRPDVQEIIVQLRVLSQGETFRTACERDETDGRRRKEFAPLRLARIGHY